jgi:hypothetical protein
MQGNFIFFLLIYTYLLIINIGLVTSDLFDDLSLCEADLRTQISINSNNGDDSHNGNFNEMVKQSGASPNRPHELSKSQNLTVGSSKL